MTDTQFLALSKLIKMRGEQTKAAARLVLVEGLRPATAARLIGISQASVCNAVARCRRGMALAHTSTAD